MLYTIETPRRKNRGYGRDSRGTTRPGWLTILDRGNVMPARGAGRTLIRSTRGTSIARERFLTHRWINPRCRATD